MGRQAIPDWIELIDLQPNARECVTICLEPGEQVALSLRSDKPIDASLVDSDTYEQWREDGECGMPAASRFVNGSQVVTWQDAPSSPPWIEVLVLFNPGDRRAVVIVEATVIKGKRDDALPAA